MTNPLVIQGTGYDDYNNGIHLAVLIYQATNYYMQPTLASPVFGQIGATQDLTTSPPTFTDMTSALVYNSVTGGACQALVDQVNASVVADGTPFDSYSYSTVPATLSSAIMMYGYPKAYEGTTLRGNAFPIFKDATVSSGVAIFYLTVDGTSTGAALFPNGIIADSVSLTVNDATASYQMSYAFTNSNKTLTVTTNKLTTANILTGLLGQSAANGAVVRLQVYGY